MVHSPAFTTFVYRIPQNSIQPPSAKKNHSSTSASVLCSPRSVCVCETKCRARRNRSQVSAKVKTVHFQLWAAASLRTKRPMNCAHRKHALIPIKKIDRHPTKDTATDCGFSSGCYLCCWAMLSSKWIFFFTRVSQLPTPLPAFQTHCSLPNMELPRFASIKSFSFLSNSLTW